MVKIKYVDNPKKLQFEMKELNKVRVIKKSLNEIKHDLLGNYVGEFEMVGILSIADHTPETHIRFRNITDYESYINVIDLD